MASSSFDSRASPLADALPTVNVLVEQFNYLLAVKDERIRELEARLGALQASVGGGSGATPELLLARLADVEDRLAAREKELADSRHALQMARLERSADDHADLASAPARASPGAEVDVSVRVQILEEELAAIKRKTGSKTRKASSSRRRPRVDADEVRRQQDAFIADELAKLRDAREDD